MNVVDEGIIDVLKAISSELEQNRAELEKLRGEIVEIHYTLALIAQGGFTK